MRYLQSRRPCRAEGRPTTKPHRGLYSPLPAPSRCSARFLSRIAVCRVPVAHPCARGASCPLRCGPLGSGPVSLPGVPADLGCFGKGHGGRARSDALSPPRPVLSAPMPAPPLRSPAPIPGLSCKRWARCPLAAPAPVQVCRAAPAKGLRGPPPLLVTCSRHVYKFHYTGLTLNRLWIVAQVIHLFYTPVSYLPTCILALMVLFSRCGLLVPGTSYPPKTAPLLRLLPRKKEVERVEKSAYSAKIGPSEGEIQTRKDLQETVPASPGLKETWTRLHRAEGR